MDSFTAWLEEKDIELRTEDAANASAIDLHHAVSYHCDVLTAGAWPISSAVAEHKIFCHLHWKLTPTCSQNSTPDEAPDESCCGFITCRLE